ncbi:MAG: DUF1854 domain-containing protein [Propionivibrio sp.]|jgi:hypothetical protein|uniref:cyanophycin metabolism-associated DUF1854 family protein n=1 Tax=Propionivibrio sp. TaxID=2212460 RepID=UPI001B4E78C5|nr:DUF1854 domain-containing protein [Propionivibrio sp.]MBP7204013.1 DUF1854 domain-containing protein [Propionivibrio sp.]
MTTTADFQLQRDAFGRLMLIDSEGTAHAGVTTVRAFPISSPEDGIAIVDPYGHELAWIDRVDDLPADLRALVEGELASREFMPIISRIVDVSSFATPSTWKVVTNHGDTQFVLKGEEDIRRLGIQGLLIADSHGIHFLIRDRYALDAHSRKILDRFL